MTSVLYIAGATRSGSTALSLLLNNHPQICAVSQIEWLSDYARRQDGEPCTCGCPISECPFWRRVAERFSALANCEDDPTFSNAYVQTMASMRLGRRTALLHTVLLSLGNTTAFRAVSTV